VFNTDWMDSRVRPQECSLCGGGTLEKRGVMVPTERKTIAGTDYPNCPAAVIVCTRCGHAEWFFEPSGE